MKQPVRVVSVRYACDSKPKRAPDEDLEAYAARVQQVALNHLSGALSSAFEAVRRDAQDDDAPPVTFVTAPEFYWNVRWDALRDVDELHALVDLQLDPVRRAIGAIADRFPVQRYGPIVFLPGTVAMLVKHEAAADVPDNGMLVGPYVSLNFTFATTNFLPPLAHDDGDGDGDAPRRAAIWPKRHTSWIDYGNSVDAPGTPLAHTFRLGDGTLVTVLKTSDVSPQSATAEPPPSSPYQGPRLSDSFDNRLGDAPPFGIDICLDFLKWRRHPGNDVKPPHLDDVALVLDFVLSYGVNPTDRAFDVPDSLQYIAHNDGRSRREVVVFAVDRTRTRWQRIAEAPCVRHLSSSDRERVAIHAFDVDVPGADGTP
ncbi:MULTISPECIES: hypothetical protein [unclassified Burkholderia]|uniref:hypothetical protein n=1 Tax=unclassified Burkholderia TaxID=2613784 RepID=UPI001E3FFF1D|nr:MULTISPECIES: hypothetical protein [unclassified Burkholderia]UEP31103.1 hypothetical protein LMA01_17935 [Burkholderia sp. B21-007]UEP43620.1 hypothetical protein LMA02_26565 [Burkholderia sp. B21-005]